LTSLPGWVLGAPASFAGAAGLPNVRYRSCILNWLRVGAWPIIEQMRVALHFDPNHELLAAEGGYEVTDVVLRAIIANGAFKTCVRLGDLMLKHEYAIWTTDIFSTTQVREYLEPLHTKAGVTLAYLIDGRLEMLPTAQSN
jgi:hypothetical protein